MTVMGTLLNHVPRFLRPLVDRILKSPIGFRLAKSAFWSLMGTVIARGLGLVSSIVVARVLGNVTFGELGIIQSTFGMFQLFAGFGLGLTAGKYVSEFRGGDPQRCGRIMGLSSMAAAVTGGLAAVAILVLAPWLAAETLARPELTGLLRICSIMLLLGALTGAQNGALAGFEAFKTIANISLFSGIISFPLMVGGVYFAGLTGAVWGLTASMAANWALNVLALRRQARSANIPVIFSRACLGEWRILWRYSLPAVLSGTLVAPVVWIGNMLLVNQPNGYAQMGIFNAANQWRTLAIFLPNIVSSVVLPVLSSYSGSGAAQKTGFGSTLRIAYSGIVLLAIPTVVTMCVLGTLIARLYGKGYSGMEATLVALIYCAGVQALGSLSGSSICAKGAMWFGLLVNCIWAASFLGAFCFFLRQAGSLGLGLSYAISYLIMNLVTLIPLSILKVFPWPLTTRTIIGALVLAPLCFLPTFLKGSLQLWMSPAAVILAVLAAWRLSLVRPGAWQQAEAAREAATATASGVVSAGEDPDASRLGPPRE